MTVVLFIAFIVAVVYYYSPKIKNEVEEPKFRMMDDDDKGTVHNDSPHDDKER